MHIYTMHALDDIKYLSITNDTCLKLNELAYYNNPGLESNFHYIQSFLLKICKDN